jgi:hypothetical protein
VSLRRVRAEKSKSGVVRPAACKRCENKIAFPPKSFQNFLIGVARIFL